MRNKKEYSIQSILYPSLNSNLDGISIDIFVKGCAGPYCKGCHNKELQEFTKPNVSIEQIIKAINLYKDNVSVVTIMGGEPLDMDESLLFKLVKTLKETFPNLSLSLFTRRDFEEIKINFSFLLIYLNYVKCGRYEEDNKSEFGSFLASKNQKMYKKTGNLWIVQYPD